MTSRKRVQPAHMSARYRDLHGALIDIVSVFNRPDRDALMVRRAGIALDRALFPLLVGIERLGPIGVVDLAARLGRDYTTVSRQVARLESLGLVERQSSPADRRVRTATVTAKGKAMTDAVDRARQQMAEAIFATWPDRDIANLIRLVRKFADDLSDDERVRPARIERVLLPLTSPSRGGRNWLCQFQEGGAPQDTPYRQRSFPTGSPHPVRCAANPPPRGNRCVIGDDGERRGWRDGLVGVGGWRMGCDGPAWARGGAQAGMRFPGRSAALLWCAAEPGPTRCGMGRLKRGPALRCAGPGSAVHR